MLGRRRNPFGNLEKAIGYRFRRRALLDEALTHRSYRFENPDVDVDNQRLEFLGDAVLGFVAAAHVYRNFREGDEGILTSLRTQITSGRALGKVAKEIGLGEFLRVGKGELKSGGRTRPSNLADTLESVIGAAFLDGGVKAVEKILGRIILHESAVLRDDIWVGNPKGKLQEVSQRRWGCGPRYKVTGRKGPAHATIFTVEVAAGGGESASAQGPNKQAAETAAARKLLNRLGRKA